MFIAGTLNVEFGPWLNACNGNHEYLKPQKQKPCLRQDYYRYPHSDRHAVEFSPGSGFLSTITCVVIYHLYAIF